MNKTNYNSLHSMNKEELARFLSENVQYDDTPWEKWFDKNYCKKCKSIEVDRDTAIKVLRLSPFYSSGVTCAYCELHNKCKFFPDMDNIPDSYDTILMWLKEEAEAHLPKLPEGE